MQHNNNQDKKINLNYETIKLIEKWNDSCDWIDCARLYVMACKYIKCDCEDSIKLKILLNELDNDIVFGNTNLRYQISKMVIDNIQKYSEVNDKFIGDVM